MTRKAIKLGTTNTAILTGNEDLSDWSEEELMRGQRRNKNGKWTGRPPTVIPKAIHDELVRRKMSEAYDLLRNNVVKASNVLVELAEDDDVDSAVRLKASMVILDRVLGRAPETVKLETQTPWMVALNAGIVSVKNMVVDTTSRDTDEDD